MTQATCPPPTEPLGKEETRQKSVHREPSSRLDHALRLFVPPAVAAVDAAIIFASFSLAYVLRFRWQLALSPCDPAPIAEYVKASTVVSYCWLLIFRAYGLYDFSKSRSGFETFQAIARALTVGLLILLSLTWFYRQFSFSRLVCVYAWLIALLLFTSFRIALDRVKEDLHQRGRAVRRVLLVGARDLSRFLVEKMQSRPELGYRVIGVVDDRPPEDEFPCPRLGELSGLGEVLDQHRVDRVFIVHTQLARTELLATIETCERAGVPLSMVPPTFDLLIRPGDLEEIDGVPLVSVNERESRRGYELAKRLFDLCASSVALLLLAPVCLGIALWIRCRDGGPVIYTQRRVGKDGRIFRVFKFRTMVVDAEERLGELVDLETLEQPVFKISQDPRVTRTGSWLRRTSLDELPQLLNVFLGHMSLVGPRPEEEKVVARYGVEERRRLKLVPGITGLQQVECRGTPDLRERIRHDVLYLRKRTFLLDLWILLRTVRVVLSGRGAS